MNIGDKRFLELPGSSDEKYELPPLIWSGDKPKTEKILQKTERIVRSEEMRVENVLDSPEIIRMREFDLKVQLATRYIHILHAWKSGDAILRWIEQCEFTWKSPGHTLGPLVQTNIWPHTDRFRFSELLVDKAVNTPHGEDVRKAIGMRLHYRVLPGPNYFSGLALLSSGEKMARLEYENWVDQAPKPLRFFPPERFHFHIMEL